MLLGRRKMKMRLLRVKDENSQADDKLGFSRGTWDAVRIEKGSVVTFFFPWEAGSPGEVESWVLGAPFRWFPGAWLSLAHPQGRRYLCISALPLGRGKLFICFWFVLYTKPGECL